MLFFQTVCNHLIFKFLHWDWTGVAFEWLFASSQIHIIANFAPAPRQPLVHCWSPWGEISSGQNWGKKFVIPWLWSYHRPEPHRWQMLWHIYNLLSGKVTSQQWWWHLQSGHTNTKTKSKTKTKKRQKQRQRQKQSQKQRQRPSPASSGDDICKVDSQTIQLSEQIWINYDLWMR